MSRKNAQRPLIDRPTSMLELRSAKIAMRVGRQHAQTRGMVNAILQVLQRPLLGRLKWTVLGR